MLYSTESYNGATHLVAGVGSLLTDEHEDLLVLLELEVRAREASRRLLSVAHAAAALRAERSQPERAETDHNISEVEL